MFAGRYPIGAIAAPRITSRLGLCDSPEREGDRAGRGHLDARQSGQERADETRALHVQAVRAEQQTVGQRDLEPVPRHLDHPCLDKRGLATAARERSVSIHTPSGVTSRTQFAFSVSECQHFGIERDRRLDQSASTICHSGGFARQGLCEQSVRVASEAGGGPLAVTQLASAAGEVELAVVLPCRVVQPERTGTGRWRKRSSDASRGQRARAASAVGERDRAGASPASRGASVCGTTRAAGTRCPGRSVLCSPDPTVASTASRVELPSEG
jgi:hypothetical protein